MYIYANYNYYHRHRYCSLSRSVTTPVRLKENKIYDKCNMCPSGHFSHGHLYIIRYAKHVNCRSPTSRYVLNLALQMFVEGSKHSS